MAGKPARELSFVTATNPTQFKNKDVMQTVRKAVMRDYLTKSKDDSSPVDTRTKKRERPSPPVKSEAGSYVSYLLPSPSASQTYYELDSSSLLGSRTASLASSSESPLSDHVINPMIPPTPNQERLFAVADHLNQQAAQVDFVADRSEFESVLAPGSTITAQKMEFLMAFTHDQEKRARPDIFAGHDTLPGSVDLDRLKLNCATYYGSAGMSAQWLPLMLLSPESFLASILVSAPYTDLMTSAYRDNDAARYTESRQVYEVLDVLPRMINDAISKNGSNDANITSVVQLLMGQLSTPYTALINWHQTALKRMVTERGGLHTLGGNGALAMMLSHVNVEANILRSEDADPLYLEWMKSHLEKNTIASLPGPEGPLFWTSNGMATVQDSPLCRPETFELIRLMHELNEKVIKLQFLDDNENAGNMDVILVQANEKSRIRHRIRDIVARVHDMPKCHQLNPLGTPDWIYETVRLTSLQFSHAVYHRQPLYKKFTCTFDRNCVATPERIQEALHRTPMKPVWDHLAGVLYWALMVAAASCHDPVGETHEVESLELDAMSLGCEAVATDLDDTSYVPSTLTPTINDSSAPAITSTPPLAAPATPTAPTEEQKQKAFKHLVDTWSTGKQRFQEYAQVRSSDGNSSSASPPLEADNSQAGRRSGSTSLARFGPSSSTTSSHSSTPYYGDTACLATMAPPPAPLVPKEDEGKRQRLERTSTTAAAADQAQSDARRLKRAYVKRYLTANAVRVGILLRFTHAVMTTASIQRLEEVTRWLARRDGRGAGSGHW